MGPAGNIRYYSRLPARAPNPVYCDMANMSVAIGENTRHIAVVGALVVVFAVRWLGTRRRPGASADRPNRRAAPKPRLRLLEVILFGALLGITIGYVLLT
jgi:hypothetical protein